MALSEWLACFVGVAFRAGLGDLVRMPLVARVTFLMWGGLPNIDSPNFVAVAGNTSRATPRLSMY